MEATNRRETQGEPMLAGLVVVDFTQYLAGPTVTRLLAELGAEIIKVEAAPAGDPTRFMPHRERERSIYYVQQNRGKKSVCVDLNSDEGVALLADLAAGADLVVENFGPGVLERRGLGYEALSKRNPRLVMCSISAFGHGNDWSHLSGYDYIAQAFSGVMDLTGEPDGSPQPVGLAIADGVSGVTAFGAIGYALWHRDRTGRGQHIDISMVDALYHMDSYAVQQYAAGRGAYQPRRVGRRHPDTATVGLFEGPDGPVVLFVMERQWPSLCAALGRTDLVTDERFAQHASRLANRGALADIIEGWLATFATNDEALAVLAEHRVPSAPVLRVADTVTHPYFVSRGMIRSVPDPVLGEVTIPGFPLRYSDHPEPLDLVAPLLGEHNADVLAERLGLDADAIAGLQERGVLRQGHT